MRNPKIPALALAALLLAGTPALAQVYSWKDPETGQSKFSNVPPSWYSRGEIVGGPRVIATVGRRVIDDTALPYEERLLLSGRSRDAIDKLRLQRQPDLSAMNVPNPKPARTDAPAASRRSADTTRTGAETTRKKEN